MPFKLTPFGRSLKALITALNSSVIHAEADAAAKCAKG